MIIASPRWINTSHDASSLTTTPAPSKASLRPATRDAVASHATTGRRVRQTTQARITVAVISSSVTLPTVRCEYSMIEWMSAAG